MTELDQALDQAVGGRYEGGTHHDVRCSRCLSLEQRTRWGAVGVVLEGEMGVRECSGSGVGGGDEIQRVGEMSRMLFVGSHASAQLGFPPR